MSSFVSFSNAETLMTAIGQKFESLNGAYILKGSVAFANLPATLTAGMTGYVYNVTDEFTTDSRFITSGQVYPAGSNIAVADLSTYAVVTPAGSENPSNEGWYELVSGKYVLSRDTTVSAGKTYYEKTESYKFDIFAGFIDTSGISARIDRTQGLVADAFSAANAYNVGDIVVYNDTLYKFKSPHTAGDPWNPLEADSVRVEDLITATDPDELTPAQVNTLIGLLD